MTKHYGRPLEANNLEAIELRRQGLTYDQIAERQGRTWAAVKTACQRARERGALPAGYPVAPRKPKVECHEMFARTEVLSMDAVGATVHERGCAPYHMRAIDVIPCARCGLRGHVAGDPDRCLFGSATRGLGGEMASQPMRRRAA